MSSDSRDSAPRSERPERHQERIEKTWPHYEDGDPEPVSELATEHQGADAPFGNDVHPPIPLERHGNKWTVREEGTPRHDTDY